MWDSEANEETIRGVPHRLSSYWTHEKVSMRLAKASKDSRPWVFEAELQPFR